MKLRLLIASVAMGMIALAAVAIRTAPQGRILSAVPEPGSTYTRPCVNNPSTTEWPSVVLVPPINGMDGVETSDFDHDGDLDFLVPGEQSDTLFVAVNPGPSAIVAGNLQTVILSTTVGNAEGACWVDANDDGWDDVVGTNQAPGDAPELCINPGAGGDPHDAGDWTCETMTNFAGTGHGWMQCARGDWNEDGSEDLLMGGNVQTNPGEIVFIPGPITASSTGTQVVVTGRSMSIAPGDFDGDGNLDALCTDREAATGATPGLFVLWGAGDGTFTRQNLASGAGSVRMLFRLGDLDGDGESFDLCTGVDGETWSGLCYVHTTGRRWTARYLPDPGDASLWTSSDIGDINLDGYPDIWVMFDSTNGAADDSASFWLEGPFVTWFLGYRHEVDETGIKLDNGILGDWDGDGDLDGIVPEQNVGGVGVGRGLVLHLNPCL